MKTLADLPALTPAEAPHHAHTEPLDRLCQYCGAPADLYDVDGAWCSPPCQANDRQSETSWWKAAVS